MTESDVPKRFLDAGEEPDQTLAPIRGYEKVPLVSIREAIEPVQSLLYDAEAMVETARRNCRKQTDDLTCDEAAAIHLYTMQWPKPHPSLYEILNQKLRSKDRETLFSWFLFLKLFLTALFKLPSYRGTVWRGVNTNLTDQYDGDQIWWGASSCTETMKIMERFVGTDGVRTLFNIECTDGKLIRSHSYFKDENEILLMPGSYFQVVDKWSPAKDLFIIQLRQRTPAYQTIAPPFLLSLEKLHISTSKEHSLLLNPINLNTKWKQIAITIAGGNGKGDRSNQLFWPQSIYVDDNHRSVYIADLGNDRVISWKYDENSGQVIAGGKGYGSRTDQLFGPTDVIVDQQNHSIIIGERGNKRVMRWSLENNASGQIIIADIKCSGLINDQNGALYVCDQEKHEVKRWKVGEKNGTIVAGGNGKGNRLNQLDFPTSLFVDEDYSVYVTDFNNHRVMKWLKNAQEGTVVAGGNGQGNSLTQLCNPCGVIVDSLGHLYVTDHGNDRVMRWCIGAAKATIVVGGNGKGTESHQLDSPRGLAFDRQGNLYVSDCSNHRIQKFNIEKN